MRDSLEDFRASANAYLADCPRHHLIGEWFVLVSSVVSLIWCLCSGNDGTIDVDVLSDDESQSCCSQTFW